MDKRDLHYFKYRLHGINYLRFYKNLKKFGLENLTEHREEFYYLHKFKEFGPTYLNFLYDALIMKLDDIIDMKDHRELNPSCILKWVYMSLDWDGKDENNWNLPIVCVTQLFSPSLIYLIFFYKIYYKNY
ncbi:hypothetical protein LCGC14_2896480 [marine sediment metagenome]|uniref:Uncharacterized protein n=1 Tax=marine sediment metagenome TaxID=412755 RepID=A0A0F8V8V2_9ZZZZ